MPEITFVGENSFVNWGWEIAAYLFLGGLVAGLMFFGSVMRLIRPDQYRRSLVVADLAGFPLLAVGMLCLFLDLSQKLNVWRLYTTFQLSSPMSWGAWILLLAMLYLALRWVGQIPAPVQAKFLGLSLFSPVVEEEDESPEGEEEKKPAKKPSPFIVAIEWAWKTLYRLAQWTRANDAWISLSGGVLGVCVGTYTGVLLSTVASHPLWNTAILGPLFLVSGLASAGAFLCLLIPQDEHARLQPYSLLLCGIELLLLLAFTINLKYSTKPFQNAGSILFSGVFGWAFWGMVVLLGLVVPAALELMERKHRRIPFLPEQAAPVLKLIGGITLRFVIVFAGMLSFI